MARGRGETRPPRFRFNLICWTNCSVPRDWPWLSVRLARVERGVEKGESTQRFPDVLDVSWIVRESKRIYALQMVTCEQPVERNSEVSTARRQWRFNTSTSCICILSWYGDRCGEDIESVPFRSQSFARYVCALNELQFGRIGIVFITLEQWKINDRSTFTI